MAAFRYVALNPCRAGWRGTRLAGPWPSARTHLAGQDTPYVVVDPALTPLRSSAAFLRAGALSAAQWTNVLQAELIGRPVGNKPRLKQIETHLGRPPTRQRRRPKPGGQRGPWAKVD
jgi:hypothetical protein